VGILLAISIVTTPHIFPIVNTPASPPDPPIDVNKTIDFYAYGDSVTRATGDQLSPDGSDNYVLQMVKDYDPNATAMHNFDGGGMDSQWGVEHLDSHYTKNMKVFVYMFTNDPQTGLKVTDTVQDYLTIYYYVSNNGTIAIPCMPILQSRAGYPFTYSIEWQSDRIRVIESEFDKRGIYYVKMYDALDSVPGNGQIDDINTTFMPDGVHPNSTGQRIMGQYLWEHIPSSVKMTVDHLGSLQNL
jgi:lysophospholipase L1-like esterase